MDEIHRTGVVSSAEFGPAGTEVHAHVPLALAQRLGPLRLATVAAVEQQQQQQAAQDDGSGDSADEEEWVRLQAAEEAQLR